MLHSAINLLSIQPHILSYYVMLVCFICYAMRLERGGRSMNERELGKMAGTFNIISSFCSVGSLPAWHRQTPYTHVQFALSFCQWFAHAHRPYDNKRSTLIHIYIDYLAMIGIKYSRIAYIMLCIAQRHNDDTKTVSEREWEIESRANQQTHFGLSVYVRVSAITHRSYWIFGVVHGNWFLYCGTLCSCARIYVCVVVRATYE